MSTMYKLSKVLFASGMVIKNKTEDAVCETYDQLFGDAWLEFMDILDNKQREFTAAFTEWCKIFDYKVHYPELAAIRKLMKMERDANKAYKMIEPHSEQVDSVSMRKVKRSRSVFTALVYWDKALKDGKDGAQRTRETRKARATRNRDGIVAGQSDVASVTIAQKSNTRDKSDSQDADYLVKLASEFNSVLRGFVECCAAQHWDVPEMLVTDWANTAIRTFDEYAQDWILEQQQTARKAKEKCKARKARKAS